MARARLKIRSGIATALMGVLAASGAAASAVHGTAADRREPAPDHSADSDIGAPEFVSDDGSFVRYDDAAISTTGPITRDS